MTEYHRDSFNKRRNAVREKDKSFVVLESFVLQIFIPMNAGAKSVPLSPHSTFGSGGSKLWHVGVLRRYDDGDD